MKKHVLLSFLILSLFSTINSGAQTISAGGPHSIFLCTDGTVKASGDNYFGEVGNGTTTTAYSPVAVTGLAGIVSVVGGPEHSMFVKNNGTVYACGANAAGTYGNGNTTESHTPVLVSTISNVKAVAAGETHS